MKKAAVILFAMMLVVCSTVQAKNVWLEIDKIIDTAQNIKTIIVRGYNDSEMLYSRPGMQDTMRTKTWYRKESESHYCRLLDRPDINYKEWMGKWPETGDTVLAIFNSQKVIAFAEKISGDYRFWSPNFRPFAEEVFIISNKSAFRPLTGCGESLHNGDTWCSDGCLIDAGLIHER